MANELETENRRDIRVVVAGHVDHGKSTVIGRLLVDTGSLPQGKLEQIQEKCRRTAKPFEYAFLLDALKDEQAQGVTIDSARCFFKTQKRNYILIDVPGHLQNLSKTWCPAHQELRRLLSLSMLMKEYKDNSKRHGIYLSFLGIKQVCVLINKMDLVEYSRQRFDEIAKSYSDFLHTINLEPQWFIRSEDFYGDNIVSRSEKMEWYSGKTFLETLEDFKN